MKKRHKIKLTRVIISAVLLILLGFVKAEGLIRLALYMLPYLIAGYDVLLTAGRNILKGRVFDENFLMAIATVGALVLGDYPEAVFVMLFYQVGDMFESIAVGKSRKSIADLMDLNPDYANVIRNGGILTVTPDEISQGEIILVKPGEKIALDGVVTEGESSLDTAALTGESVPRDVFVGDSVSSGCININGVLKIKTTSTYETSTAYKIMELVENSSLNKAKTESFITRFSRYYTPAVVIGASLLAIIPSIITGDIKEWLGRALIFLVVSCPCALVISVPLTFFGGIGAASKQGILVKGSNYLEALAKADTAVFDKTGTLTKGSFYVSEIHSENMPDEELIRYAALVESYSTHPISVSLKKACKEDLSAHTVEEVQDISGKGISALVDKKQVFIGNERLMNELDVEIPHCSHVNTVVHIVIDGIYEGHIEISDEIKESTAEAITEMKNAGIKRTVMLTGDKKSVADVVSSKIGIDEHYAELLPAGKVEMLEGIINGNQSGTVIYTGDGINDAPVLARADVGVAMGALGSDAAIEAADVVIMDDNIDKIPQMLKIAKKTRLIVIENIIFALGIKFAVLILSTFGMASMWLAAFADVGVSVIAIMNAIRTLYIKEK